MAYLCWTSLLHVCAICTIYVINTCVFFIDTTFPAVLLKYGLSEQLLTACIDEVQAGKKPSWVLSGIPNTEFYQALHTFLKKWPKTCKSTKIAVAKFYLAIDKNLNERGGRLDNIYRFIERVSRLDPDKLMCYKYSTESACSALKQSTNTISGLVDEIQLLKQQLASSREQLHSANLALRGITDEKVKLQKQRDTALKKVSKMQLSQTSAEEDIVHLIMENADLADALSAVETELLDISSSSTCDPVSIVDFSFETKCGRVYSHSIRKLYYNLLSNEVPTSKISDIIRAVVKCFNPNVDVSQLKLPKPSCASYMRKEELKTLSNCHKATTLCNGPFRLNTDGTTLRQRKLNGIAVNDMVVSVNEVSDGSAETTISDVTKELERLRKTAHALKIPNADSINWSLVISSTSDSAATQKKFNLLVKECKDRDRVQFGVSTSEGLEVVENFCAMHLGVNLRKAFLAGVQTLFCESSTNCPVDTFVHQFCKVFGNKGTPEYECGVLHFPDFLEIMRTESSLSQQQREYYNCCQHITLERQIGNRYFVTAANATKILFLMDAANEFLKYTYKCEDGNKLEKEVYTKLQAQEEITLQLKVDGLMFVHVYADLVMLSKSSDLGKSALDMNLHYLELKLFLQEAEHNPEILFDSNSKVFPSEKRLYADKKNTNHRLNSLTVYNALFASVSSVPEKTVLHPLIVAGCRSMREKLCNYAKNQLPEGKYWSPDESTRKILSEIKPSNDLCEAILGLNDYLHKSIPNLHQMARSSIVEVKKNKTISWLHELPDKDQEKVIDLAVASRKSVHEEYKQEEKQRAEKRQLRLKEEHARKEFVKRKAYEEKKKLSQLHLIISSQELSEELELLSMKQGSNLSRKEAQKLSLVKTQINIRKKVLGQLIQIKYTFKKKNRPLNDIVRELSDYIDQKLSELPVVVRDPTLLVGKTISHKFETLNEGGMSYEWFTGCVKSYDSKSKTHVILYEGESETCNFDILLDYLNGDLKII